MATGDIWRVAIEGTYDGQSVVNVYHVRMKSASGEPAGLDDVVRSLHNAWKDQFHPSLVLTTCRSTMLSIPPLSEEATFNITGTSGTDGLPGVAPFVVSWKTAYAGRSYRGRNYYSGLTEVAATLGVITGAVVTTLQGHVNTWLAQYGDGGSSADYEVGVWSRVIGEIRDGSGVLTGYDPAGFNPITSGTVRSAIATMRSRRVGG